MQRSDDQLQKLCAHLLDQSRQPLIVELSRRIIQQQRGPCWCTSFEPTPERRQLARPAIAIGETQLLAQQALPQRPSNRRQLLHVAMSSVRQYFSILHEVGVPDSHQLATKPGSTWNTPQSRKRRRLPGPSSMR